MQIDVKTSFNIPNEREIMDLELELVSGGIRLAARSKVIGEFLKDLPVVNSEKKLGPCWADLGIVTKRVPGDPNFFVNGLGYGWFLGQGEKPNLIWLCSPKLSEGLDQVIPVPMSLNNLSDYFNQAQNDITAFYLAHVRTVKMASRVVER